MKYKNNDIRILSTSGNITALVDVGKNFNKWVLKRQKRQQLSRDVINRWPEVEQVGFIQKNPQNVSLVMANDELCGGALLATGYDFLRGKETGTVTIKNALFQKNIEIIVNLSQENIAITELPIGNLKTLRKALLPTSNLFINKAKIVPLEGIIHLVVPIKKYLNDSKQILALGKEILQKNELYELTENAVGVMFITENLYLLPVVLVPNVSFRLESSCSSGTAAVAIALSWSNTQTTSFALTQPSGKLLKATVTRNEKDRRVFIQGTISYYHMHQNNVRI